MSLSPTTTMEYARILERYINWAHQQGWNPSQHRTIEEYLFKLYKEDKRKSTPFNVSPCGRPRKLPAEMTPSIHHPDYSSKHLLMTNQSWRKDISRPSNSGPSEVSSIPKQVPRTSRLLCCLRYCLPKTCGSVPSLLCNKMMCLKKMGLFGLRL